jgi:hypothetical protein
MPATRIRAAACASFADVIARPALHPAAVAPVVGAHFHLLGTDCDDPDGLSAVCRGRAFLYLSIWLGLRNTDSYPGPHWLKWPLAVVSLPLKLAAGLAWTLYAVLTLTIHPFTLHGLAPKLESVSFTHGSNGDEHAKALAAAFSSGRMPE